jgi:hypothetical protein
MAPNIIHQQHLVNTIKNIFHKKNTYFLVITPSKPPSIASADSLVFLFNWLSDNAQSSLSEWPCSPSLPSDTLERYSKLLTILADQSSFCLNKAHLNLTLSYLKLLYYSLIIIECPTTSGQTRHLYSCSYRRLCEQILKCEKNQVSSQKSIKMIFISFAKGTSTLFR